MQTQAIDPAQARPEWRVCRRRTPAEELAILERSPGIALVIAAREREGLTAIDAEEVVAVLAMGGSFE